VATLLEIERTHINPRLVEEAVGWFDRGAVVAYATDTFFAFGCDFRNRQAVERLYRVRELDRHRPLAFLFPDLSDIARYAQVSNTAYRIMRRIFPGPYTVELEATREIPKMVMEKRRRIGIRVPDEPVLLAILRARGQPIMSTSGKTPDGEYLLTAADIERTYGDAIDCIIDSGPISGLPSTVLSLVGDVVQVIREGAGSLDGLVD
jgi:tRNA threonylcarbamoyl adenosine modification protein (Sua5/YciO/YrdC/YwlC family)